MNRHDCVEWFPIVTRVYRHCSDSRPPTALPLPALDLLHSRRPLGDGAVCSGGGSLARTGPRRQDSVNSTATAPDASSTARGPRSRDTLLRSDGGGIRSAYCPVATLLASSFRQLPAGACRAAHDCRPHSRGGPSSPSTPCSQSRHRAWPQSRCSDAPHCSSRFARSPGRRPHEKVMQNLPGKPP